MFNDQGSCKSQVQSWALRHWDFFGHCVIGNWSFTGHWSFAREAGGRGERGARACGGECCLAAGSLSVRVAEDGFDDVGEALVEVAAGFWDDGQIGRAHV